MRVGERARAEHGLRRAAAALAVALLVGPQLEGDGDDLAAVPRARAARPTALSTPPLIADQHAVRARRGQGGVARGARPAASARCSASAARSAAWSLPGERPPSSLAIVGRRRPRGLEQRAPSASDDARAAGRDGRAAALGVEAWPARSGRRRTRSATRTRSPQAQPPALPTSAPSGTGPRPAGSRQVLLEGMHPRSLGRPVGERAAAPGEPRWFAACTAARCGRRAATCARGGVQTNWLIVW